MAKGIIAPACDFCRAVFLRLRRFLCHREPKMPPPPYTGKPSLEGAFERLSRAGEHIEELKRAITPIKFELDGVPQQQEMAPGKIGTLVMFNTPTIPPRISAIIGDVCYNLRAALDYLVFNLSALDSGLDYPGTQFPIEDRPKNFRYRVETRGLLGGMNARHRAAIEALQPYKGSQWAKTLKEISNPDKHRNLAATAVDASLRTLRTIIATFSGNAA
jgi:hypothetical protein